MIDHEIIVPVHNEANFVKPFVETFLNLIRNRQNFKLVLVENGSTDKTYEECLNLEKLYPNEVSVICSPRASYGASIRLGIEKSTADLVSILELDFLDVDFITMSRKLVTAENFEVVIASKRHRQSIDRRPWNRIIITFAFNLLLKIIFNFKGTDTHGLKTFKGSTVRKLISLCQTSDESLQTELVLIAERLNSKKAELPIKIIESRAAPISVLKRSPRVYEIIKDLQKSLNRDFSKISLP